MLLEYLPKPLLEEIVKGNCLPIIGSGFSLNANTTNKFKIPLWDDLGKSFANYLKGYTYTSPLEAISAYSHEYSRNNLISKLHDFLGIDQMSPGTAHTEFAKLSFKLICTTNFDFLLEKSYPYCKPIIDESQLSITTDSNEVNILKIHGDLNHPKQLVVTEEDYDLFLERNPLLATYLSYLLIVKTPLFIGYSIDDPDFRQIFKIVNERLGSNKRQAYTIKLNASTHEIAKFERRGVKVINIIDKSLNYNTLFTNLFKELNIHWNSSLLKNSNYSRNDTKTELLAEELSTNRLCFFSIPFTKLSFYKEVIFPIVESHGLIPISADQVISQGDTILAKINALISKSQIIVIDLQESNNNVLSELGVVLNQENKKIIVIKNDDYNSLTNLQNKENIYKNGNAIVYIKKYENDPYNDNNFLTQISGWLKRFAESLAESLEKEPLRLLNKKEFRAATISAFSVLEAETNQKKTNQTENLSIQNYTQGRKFDFLITENYINEEEFEKLKEYYNIRNKLVHGDTKITKEEASKIVNFIMTILNKLRKN